MSIVYMRGSGNSSPFDRGMGCMEKETKQDYCDVYGWDDLDDEL